MKDRQQQLLSTIVKEYIKSAQPVASGFLVEKFEEPVSSATIRNEMVELEKQGYIIQPHTSAGRIPTAKAYQFYVDHYLESKPLAKNLQAKLIEGVKNAEGARGAIKQLAKNLAELSQEAVIVAFAKNDSYYTGLSNLFAKPEFENQNLVVNLSKVIDHLDNTMQNLFDQIEQPQIMIGPNCPFAEHCSTIATKYHYNKNHGLIALLGPIRMDYQTNLNTINFITNL
jgi:heat-inducible transcriptional repressor